jgi:phosphotransferase system IIB component
VLPWQHGKIKKCATRLRSETKQVLPWQHGKIKKCATRLRSEMKQVLPWQHGKIKKCATRGLALRAEIILMRSPRGV